jgi:hypothetical protein
MSNDLVREAQSHNYGNTFVTPRQPMGLPAGSIRAILALMVFGLFWALLLIPEGDKPIHVPLYLYYLMFLILGSYFAARGSAVHPPGAKVANPLHLPKWSLRIVMLLGFVAAFGWGFYQNPDFFRRLNPPTNMDPNALSPAYLALLIAGAFLAGILVSGLAKLVLADRVTGLPAWYQDIQAWIALLAMLGLAGEAVYRLLIYPRAAPERQFDLPHWEGFLAALVSFYFGARSNG